MEYYNIFSCFFIFSKEMWIKIIKNTKYKLIAFFGFCSEIKKILKLKEKSNLFKWDPSRKDKIVGNNKNG